MEKVQVDNEKYILYSPDSLKYITDNMFGILDIKLEEYKAFFGLKEYRKLEIYYFDDIQKFRSYVDSLRGYENSLPEYAAGVYDEGKIIAFLPTNLVVGSPWYNYKMYNAPHELFHIKLHSFHFVQGTHRN